MSNKVKLAPRGFTPRRRTFVGACAIGTALIAGPVVTSASAEGGDYPHRDMVTVVPALTPGQVPAYVTFPQEEADGNVVPACTPTGVIEYQVEHLKHGTPEEIHITDNLIDVLKRLETRDSDQSVQMRGGYLVVPPKCQQPTGSPTPTDTAPVPKGVVTAVFDCFGKVVTMVHATGVPKDSDGVANINNHPIDSVHSSLAVHSDLSGNIDQSGVGDQFGKFNSTDQYNWSILVGDTLLTGKLYITPASGCNSGSPSPSGSTSSSHPGGPSSSNPVVKPSSSTSSSLGTAISTNAAQPSLHVGSTQSNFPVAVASAGDGVDNAVNASANTAQSAQPRGTNSDGPLWFVGVVAFLGTVGFVFRRRLQMLPIFRVGGIK